MSSFVSGFLITVGLFAFCVLTVYLINKLRYDKISKNKPAEKTMKQSEAGKIYYITKVEKAKPIKRKKKLDVALKCSVLTPEQFRHIDLNKETAFFDE